MSERKQTRNRRILLIGCLGQIGWELQRCIVPQGEVIAVDRPAVELSRPETVLKLIRAVSPDVIINAGAYTAVDRAEEEEDLARQINAAAPAVMAEEAKRLNAAFITYSTDYVFDGRKRTPYCETDIPNPLSAYGRTKAEGDLAVQAIDGSYVILRTSWVYGARGKNFFLTMMRLLKEKEQLRIVDDQVGAPTWSRSVAEVTSQILAERLSPKNSRTASAAEAFADVKGIYNLTAAGHTSWCGFSEWIASSVRSQNRDESIAQITPISSDQYPLPAKRPHNSILSNIKVNDVFGIRVPEWDQLASLVMDELLSRKTM